MLIAKTAVLVVSTKFCSLLAGAEPGRRATRQFSSPSGNISIDVHVLFAANGRRLLCTEQLGEPRQYRVRLFPGCSQLQSDAETLERAYLTSRRNIESAVSSPAQ